MNEFKVVAKVVGTHALINAGFVLVGTAMYDLFKLYMKK